MNRQEKKLPGIHKEKGKGIYGFNNEINYNFYNILVHTK